MIALIISYKIFLLNYLLIFIKSVSHQTYARKYKCYSLIFIVGQIRENCAVSFFLWILAAQDVLTWLNMRNM